MQPKRTGGWISLWREIQQFELWPGNRDVKKEPFTRFEAWIDILLSASYEDHVFTLEGQQVEERRGEWVVSIRYLGNRWGWSNDKVATFLRFLKGFGEIDHSTERITRRLPGKIIVTKYDTYQTHGVESRTHKRTHKEGLDDRPEAASPQQEPAGRIPDAYDPHPETKSENRTAKNRTKPNKVIKNSIAGLDESSEESSSHPTKNTFFSSKGNIPYGGDGKPSPDHFPSGDVPKQTQDLDQVEKRAGTISRRSRTADECSAADPAPSPESTHSGASTGGAVSYTQDKPKKGRGDPRVREVINYFREKFREKDGHDYLITDNDWGKYSKLVKQVLESEENKEGYTLDEMKLKIDAYFNESWIKVFSFGHFIKTENLNKWAQKKLQEAREKKEWEEKIKANMRKYIIDSLLKGPRREAGRFDEDGGLECIDWWHPYGRETLNEMVKEGIVIHRLDLGEDVWDFPEAEIETRGLDRNQRKEYWKDSEWRRTDFEGWWRARERKNAAHMKGPIRKYLEEGPVRKGQLMAESWFDEHAQVAFEELVEIGEIIEGNEFGLQCCGLKKFGESQFEDLEEEWKTTIAKYEEEILGCLGINRLNQRWFEERFQRIERDGYDPEALKAASKSLQERGEIGLSEDLGEDKIWEITGRGEARLKEIRPEIFEHEVIESQGEESEDDPF